MFKYNAISELYEGDSLSCGVSVAVARTQLIHFFPTFSRDASGSPFAQELAALGVPHRLFSGEVKLRYNSRIALLLLGWPKLAWFALKSAARSLIFSKPSPSTVVVGSDIEAIIFAIVRSLSLSKKP